MSSRTQAALALCCVPAFMAALDNLVVTTALATIRRSLHASIASLSWTLDAYILSLGVLMLAGAALGDRLGRRRMFVAGLCLFTLASAGAALSTSAGWLIAARAVQGCGAALVLPLSLALVSAMFPPGRRGAAIGIWGAVTGAAVAIGPLVGGAIVQGIDWQWIFWLNVPVGVLAIALAPRLLAESYGDRRRLDLAGLALASGGLVGIVWGIVRSGQVGWTSAQTLPAILAGVALLAAFAAWQLQAPAPLLPTRLLASTPIAAANGATFLMAAALWSAAFLIPQYLQTALGHRPLATGALLLPWTAAPLVVTPLAGIWADRIGNRPPLVAGLALQAVGFGWLAAIVSPTLSYAGMLPPLLVAGIGIALVFPAVANAVVGGIADEDVNLASASNSSFREIGGALGVALAVTVFAHNGSIATAQQFSDGLVPALMVACGLSLAGAVLGLAIGPYRAAQLSADLEEAVRDLHGAG
jgi:EmrB/QacA subfamily drug resistance transporter